MLHKIREYKDRLNKVDQNKLKDVEFEKGDGRAMFIAALIVFMPPLIVTCAAIYFVLWLIFLR